MKANVWITGVGVATSLGHNYADLSDNLLNGRCGIQRIRQFDTSDHPSRIGAEVTDIPCPPEMSLDDFSKLSRQEQTSLWCFASALHDACWWEQRQALRVGVVLGIGAEWLGHWETDDQQGGKKLYERTDELAHVQKVCQWLQLSGPAVTLSAACASGNYALSLARRWLQMGWVDICLAGACDTGLTPMSLAGFGNLRALSRCNDNPQAASRPFDCDRDGFVMGEGGAMFVLEREETARERLAYAYARIAGCGASSDAHHMVMPNPNPQPAAGAVRAALADARISPREIDYINAHATGTQAGDVAEVRVLESVFENDLSRIPVSSTKSMTGHLLTASAAVETVACLAALERNAIPPTVNLDNIDPQCRLNHVAHEARPNPVRVTLSNSFGFGGSNTCLILAAV